LVENVEDIVQEDREVGQNDIVKWAANRTQVLGRAIVQLELGMPRPRRRQHLRTQVHANRSPGFERSQQIPTPHANFKHRRTGFDIKPISANQLAQIT
jgi:hypothetical protein